MRQYITTAIDFPNAAPHMGHVMEKIMADSIARWFRLRGDETRFQIGTDDHGIKMQRTAEKAGMHPADLVKQNAPKFQKLFDRLDISYDVFVSTSLTQGHYETVQALWSALSENGLIERRTYAGLYCTGCESFVTKKDLEDGLCPNHRVPPEEVSEENWFFLLKSQEGFLRTLLHPKTGTYHIVPDYRGNEVRAFLEEGLDDISFSRPRSTLYWGVPVPGDEEQVMYVWCDNLTNYISTLGYCTEKENSLWWDEAEVTHVIGKDIARFHALNWPAMLHGADIRTPDRLLVHGFITSEGQKMSKSIGNVVDPCDVIERYGVDPLRFYVSHEIPVGRDGDFSWERFHALYDAKLRNDLGNLLNRVLVLLHKEGGKIVVPDSPVDRERAGIGWEAYAASMNAFALHAALHQAMELVSTLNIAIDRTKPWTLTGEERLVILSRFAESLRHVSLMLLPFLPQTAQRIATQLHVPYADQMLKKTFVLGSFRQWGACPEWKSAGTPEILFAPIEAK